MLENTLHFEIAKSEQISAYARRMSDAVCSARCLYASYSAAGADVFNGGSAQCRIVQ